MKLALAVGILIITNFQGHAPFAEEPPQPDKTIEAAEVIRRLPCEQVAQPVFPTQIGKPIMWGISAKDWGSREFGALASRIEDCQKSLPVGDKSYRYIGLAKYVRDQYERPRKEAEERERQAAVLRELQRQNQAAAEREQAVRQAEAEQSAREAAAVQAEKDAEEKERATKRTTEELERKQQAAATEKTESDAARERIDQAKRLAIEAEARETAAKARAAAAAAEEEAQLRKAQEDQLSHASSEVKLFLAHNPQLLSTKVVVSPKDICQGRCTPAELFSALYLALTYEAEAVLTACNESDAFTRELAEAHRRSVLLEHTLAQMYGVSPSDVAQRRDAVWKKLTDPEAASIIKGTAHASPEDCYTVLKETSLTLGLDFQQ